MLNYQYSHSDDTFSHVVLLHGLFGSLDNLSVVKKGLTTHFNVLSIDLPDHGKSPHSKTFSFKQYAHSVIEVIDHLNLTHVAIVGHSLGGKIAMQLALEYPQRVTKLVVADIAPVAYRPRHQNVFNALTAVDLDNVASRAAASDIMLQHLEEPGVAQFLLKSLYQHEDTWHWRFNLSMLIDHYPALSAAITSEHPSEIPTLFIKGGLSDYITTEHRPAIAALFPNATAKIIGAAGHWLHAEKPAIFNRLVNDFLQNG